MIIFFIALATLDFLLILYWGYRVYVDGGGFPTAMLLLSIGALIVNSINVYIRITKADTVKPKVIVDARPSTGYLIP